jgi:ribonuclease-3
MESEPLMDKRREFNFVQLRRFTEAMTHGSYNGTKNNKHLALLGDAVIDLAVCEHILENCPELSVGAVTERRAVVVNKASLAQKARALNLTEHLLLGNHLKDEEETEHILAEALEALAGAVFAEHGYEHTRRFIEQHIIPETITTQSWNPKGKLQEVTQNAGLGIPTYRTIETSPSGRDSYESTVYLEGKAFGKGTGASKREAEERAAKHTLLSLKAEEK